MRKMNAAQCRTVTKPGLYRADETLSLCVKPTGRKSWVHRIVVYGRRRNLASVPIPWLRCPRPGNGHSKTA